MGRRERTMGIKTLHQNIFFMRVVALPGPYMLGTGLLLYMLSKEIYVINHETFAAASIGAVVIYGVKTFGPSVAEFADKLNEVGHVSGQ